MGFRHGMLRMAMGDCGSFMDGHGFYGMARAKNRTASTTLAACAQIERRCGDIQVRRQI